MSAHGNSAEDLLELLDADRVLERLRAISVVAEMSRLGLQRLGGVEVDRLDMIALFELVHEESSALLQSVATARAIAEAMHARESAPPAAPAAVGAPKGGGK